jgi:hypothetical protein
MFRWLSKKGFRNRSVTLPLPESLTIAHVLHATCFSPPCFTCHAYS